MSPKSLYGGSNDILFISAAWLSLFSSTFCMDVSQLSQGEIAGERGRGDKKRGDGGIFYYYTTPVARRAKFTPVDS